MAQLVLKNILAGSGNVLAGGDNNGNVNKVTIGSNLTLSGGVLSATGGGSGSVTSVGLTTSAGALTITNSPITTSGNIGINFAGNTTQYVRGDGSLATFPTTNQASKLITEVYNETGATLTKGTIVYINGGHGNLPTVTKAKANSDATSAQTYGVVQADITNNNNGNVVVIGSLIDLDTQAYADGTQLYLSGTTAGTWTDVKPQAPIHLVYVGIVTRSHPTQGIVEIKIQNGYELDELHDVKIVDVANNDGIFYNSSTSLWENKTIAEVLGYTPANDASVVKLTGNQTVGGVKTFSSESIFDGGITLTGGDLVLKSGTYTSTINTDTLSESRSILFPDNSGTVALLTDIDYPVTSVFGRTGDVVAESGDYDTDMVDEGTTNLYYTNARARAALSANTGSALTYNSTTGRFTLVAAESGVDGYLTGDDWDYFDGKQNSLGTGTTSQFLRGDLVWAAPPTPALEDLTDVGITSPTNGQLLRYQVGTWVNWTPNYVSSTYFSATAPLSYNSGTGVFSISQATTSTNGYLSSTDWNTFNNKQNALTNPVTGSGASGYIAKWNTASTITNSLIYEASSKVGINTTNMVSLFDVTKNALGVTVVDTSGITLKNETEAITGNQQISPALHFKSNGWNNLASASQSADWINYSLPIQGNAVTSNLIWASSINGASYTTRFTLSSAGNGTFTGTLAASNLSGTNTGDVTIGTANGLSLSGQAISLALASTSTTGALSSTDWNTFNGKQAQINGTGFVKASGTTISYDNSTYLTTTAAASTYLTISSAASTYLPLTGGTLTGTLNVNTPGSMSISLGGLVSSWAGSTTYPTIWGSAPERYIMLLNPHLVYTQNGNYGYTGSMNGATIRMGSDSATTSYWDFGIGTNSVGTDKFSLGRAGTSFISIPNTGNFLINTTTDAGYKLDVNGTSRFSGYATLASAGFGGYIDLTGVLYLRNNVNYLNAAGNSWNSFLVRNGERYDGYFTNIYNSNSIISSGGTDANSFIARARASDDIYAQIMFQNNAGSNNNGVIGVERTGTNGGAMYFYTKPDGGSIAERLRITTGGSLGVNNSNPVNTAWGNETNTKQLSINGSGYAVINLTGANGGTSKTYSAGVGDTRYYMCYDNSLSKHILTAYDGNLGVGTTSPISAGGAYTGIDIRGTSGGSVIMGSASTVYGYLYADPGGYNIQSANIPIIFYTNGVEKSRISTIGNLLVGTNTDTGAKLQVKCGSLNAQLSGRNTWGGGTYPTLYNSAPEEFIMIHLPHLPYLQNGVNGYAGATYGAVIRYAANAATTAYWDAGIPGPVGTDIYAIQRNGSTLFTINNTAGVTSYGGFFESSDKRLKKEISDNPVIDGIANVKPKLYTKNGIEEFGYYAQDFENVLPSAINEGTDGYLTLSYQQVHTAKIAQLEAELAELKEIVKNLIK